MSKKYFGGHELKKGKFITPINQITNVENVSWYKDRMPEYLWISLIISKHGHSEGLKLGCDIIKFLKTLDDNIFVPRWSNILKMDEDKQYRFYKYIFDLELGSVLAPLVIFFNYSNAPIFIKVFSSIKFEKDKYIETLTNVLKLVNFHQSEISTDTRFCVFYCMQSSGKIIYHQDMKEEMEQTFDDLNKYIDLDHSDTTIMPKVRSFIRSSEGGAANLSEDDNSEFIEDFGA